jgi:hypothetical protein
VNTARLRSSVNAGALTWFDLAQPCKVFTRVLHSLPSINDDLPALRRSVEARRLELSALGNALLNTRPTCNNRLHSNYHCLSPSGAHSGNDLKPYSLTSTLLAGGPRYLKINFGRPDEVMR